MPQCARTYPHLAPARPTSTAERTQREKQVAAPEKTWFARRMALPYPTIIPGLRSPSEQVGGLVYFGRMLDKIRLAAAGKLPEGWQPMRGFVEGAFDWRCCLFLGIDYAALEAETLKGDKTDEQLLTWAFEHGRHPTEDEIEVWNAFMLKRGWRDAGTQRLNERLAEIGLPPGTVQTMFEFIDIDEGRLKPKVH
jgi:gluconokinase